MLEIPIDQDPRGRDAALCHLAFRRSGGTMRIDKSYQRFDGRDVFTDPDA